MDIEEYRRQVEESVAEAAARRSGPAELISRSRTRSGLNTLSFDSLTDAGGAGGADGFALGAAREDDTTTLLAIARSRDEDESLRVEALAGLADDAIDRPDVVPVVIGLAADTGEPRAVRVAALALLGQLRFTPLVLLPHRPEYMNALRGMVDDEHAEIRARALEVLAQERDEYAQRRLLEDLEQGGGRLVPPDRAIQLLGYDVHAEYFPLLRRLAHESGDTGVRREAVRLLSSDPASATLLRERFRDKGEHPEVRARSAVALQSVAPAEFEAQVREVVLDDDEDDEVRAASITALGSLGNPALLQGDAELKDRLSTLQRRDSTPLVGQAVQRLKARHSLD